MRFAFFAAAGTAMLAFLCFGVLGFVLSPSLDTTLAEADAVAALAFTFDDRPGAWQNASGQIAHTWLYRQAYIGGEVRRGTASVSHTEQVLKVGWPFTVVRGFIRSAGSDVEHTGVAWSAETVGQPARLWPVQPVWPGVVFYGLAGLAFALVGTRVRRPTAAAP
ncbi:MAG: hypothetical protein AAGG50_11985 [Bacteroidota bacterium]